MCLAHDGVSLSFGDLATSLSLCFPLGFLFSFLAILSWMSFPSLKSKTLKVSVMVKLHRSKLDNVVLSSRQAFLFAK